MIPGARGIFGFLFEKISTKYDTPPIIVEWIAIFICWILYLIFEPSKFSNFDLYFLAGIYVASFFIYLIGSLIAAGNLEMLSDVFSKPSVVNQRDRAEWSKIAKYSNKINQKTRTKRKKNK